MTILLDYNNLGTNLTLKEIIIKFMVEVRIRDDDGVVK